MPMPSALPIFFFSGEKFILYSKNVFFISQISFFVVEFFFSAEKRIGQADGMGIHK